MKLLRIGQSKNRPLFLKLETPDTSLPGCIDFRTAAYFLKPIAVAYLFAWLEVGLPFSDVLGILLVQLFEFQCLVFHQELAFLVLHLTMIQVWSLKHFFNSPQFTVNKKPLQAKLGLADFDLEDEKVGQELCI